MQNLYFAATSKTSGIHQLFCLHYFGVDNKAILTPDLYLDTLRIMTFYPLAFAFTPIIFYLILIRVLVIWNQLGLVDFSTKCGSISTRLPLMYSAFQYIILLPVYSVYSGRGLAMGLSLVALLFIFLFFIFILQLVCYCI